ncbi:MAG: hypothetical protein DRH12_18155, partial [Deltaproteobacteria bacterium]
LCPGVVVCWGKNLSFMNHLYQDSPIYSHALCVTCPKLEAMKGWGLILWVKIRIAVAIGF